MALPPLNLKIGADTRDLEKSIERVQGEISGLQRATDGVARGLTRFGDGATNLGKKMLPLSGAISAAAGGAFLLAKNTADVADEIAKTSRAAGVSSDALQELRFALGQVAGVGEQQTSAMLTTLTRRMGEAAAGNDNYTAALEKIGISLEDVASGAVTTDQVFMALTDAMQGAGSDAEAAAMGMELLGREGAALGGKLRGADADLGSLRDRAQELGIVLAGDTLGAAEDFNDKMDELSKQMGAARAQIGQALLPVALALATAFQEKVVPAITTVADSIGKAVDWFGQLPGPVQEAAGVIATALGVGGPVLMAIGALSKALGALMLASGPIGLFIGAAALAVAAWMKWGDDIKRIVGQAADWFKSEFGGIVEAGQIIFDGLQAQAQNFIDLARAIFTGDLKGIMDAMIGIFTAPLKIIAGLWESDFAEPIRETVDGAVQWVTESFNGLMEFFRGLPEQMLEIGRNIITGLWEGLRSAWEEFSIRDTVSGWASSIGNAFKERLGIQSPSRVFHEFGMNIGEGLRNGIQSTFGMVRNAVQGLGQQVTSGAFDMAKGVVDAMGQMFQGSKPIAAAQALINTFQGITEALKLPFPASLAAAARVAAQGFAAVRGIQSARPGSGGSRSSGGSGGATQAQAAPQQLPTQTLRFDFGGQNAMGMEQIVDLLNDAYDRGYRVKAVMA